jgi:uncharacterized protein with von Willebrand factor type A (vWA) domain
MISRQTSLSKNIVQFCRFLRQKNFTVSIEEEALALQALSFIEYSNKNIFRTALKAILCRSHAQIIEFDILFNQYWKEWASAVDSKLKSQQQRL